MEINYPVTNRQADLPSADVLVAFTNINGAITYVNKKLVAISGFERNELLGANHNLLRHPDMPMEVFEDLWMSLRNGKPWVGLIKNRAKNGDYYWVNAHFTPIRDYEGRIVEYMSVKYAPTPEEISAAEQLYATL